MIRTINDFIENASLRDKIVLFVVIVMMCVLFFTVVIVTINTVNMKDNMVEFCEEKGGVVTRQTYPVVCYIGENNVLKKYTVEEINGEFRLVE